MRLLFRQQAWWLEMRLLFQQQTWWMEQRLLLQQQTWWLEMRLFVVVRGWTGTTDTIQDSCRTNWGRNSRTLDPTLLLLMRRRLCRKSRRSIFWICLMFRQLLYTLLKAFWWIFWLKIMTFNNLNCGFQRMDFSGCDFILQKHSNKYRQWHHTPRVKNHGENTYKWLPFLRKSFSKFLRFIHVSFQNGNWWNLIRKIELKNILHS